LRSDPETGKPHFIGSGVDQNVNRLDIFVDETSPMKLTEAGCQVNRYPKESAEFHRLPQQAIQSEDLGTGILKDQHRPPFVPNQR
jgi:hypothetical protein